MLQPQLNDSATVNSRLIATKPQRRAATIHVSAALARPTYQQAA